MKVVFVHAKLNSGSVSKIFEEEKILIPQSFWWIIQLQM